jgi:hypothetical protein
VTNAQNPAKTTAAVRAVERGAACETIAFIMDDGVMSPPYQK